LEIIPVEIESVNKHVGGDLADLPLAQAIGPREHGQHSLEVGAETPTGYARGQFAAGCRAAGGTDEAVEPILIDDGLNPGQFGDLVDQGLGIVASKPMATAATGGRLAVERLADLLRRHQAPTCLAMSTLAAAFLPTGRVRRSPLHSDRVGRGRFGRVGGVKFEPVLEISEPVLEKCESLLVGLDQ
jgi:hypothetical protein